MARIDFNAADYEPWAGEDESPKSEYDAWLETCKRMDAEREGARRAWQEARITMQETIAWLKANVEEKRAEYRRLELRAKPLQPRSARKSK